MAKPGKIPKLPVQQLVILALCRLADPISFSSVFPYLPEMIESFNVPENEVGRWAGITSAVFSLSQAITGVFWGRASDRFGRKPVILVGMICVMSSGLLFGFSKNLPMAIVARSLAGASNGNVGILRTTVAEMVPQKELQPKAFSVMPLMWTIGSIFGPGFGGAIANPAARYQVFDNEFFRKFPYALPNIVACLFFFVGLTSGALFLKETLETKKHRRDYGRMIGKTIVRSFRKKPKKYRLPVDEEQSASLLKRSPTSSASTVNGRVGSKPSKKPVLPDRPTYREVFSKQSNINLLTYTLLALHSVAYDQLLPIFMHHPPQTNRSSNPDVHLPFKFSGGFGIDSNRIGLLFTLYGIAGTLIQFLIFPPLARHHGVLACYRTVALAFPAIYLLTPFAILLPTPLTQQLAIFAIMLLKCFAAIFAFPCITILLTNSAVSLRVLGTLNGVATSVSALGRAMGPAVGGAMFEVGAVKGWAILPWWVLAGFAGVGAVPVAWIVEMEGFGGGVEDGSGGDDDDGDDDGDDDDEVSRPREGRAVGVRDGISVPTYEEDGSAAITGPPLLLPPLPRVSSPKGVRVSRGPGGNNNRLGNGPLSP